MAFRYHRRQQWHDQVAVGCAQHFMPWWRECRAQILLAVLVAALRLPSGRANVPKDGEDSHNTVWPDHVYEDVMELYLGSTRRTREAWPMRDFQQPFREAIQSLHTRGRCVMSSLSLPDGVGAQALRAMATMIVAEDAGCEFVWQDFGIQGGYKGGGGAPTAVYQNGTTLCRYKMIKQTTPEDRAGEARWRRKTLCDSTDWDVFFNFGGFYRREGPGGKPLHIQVGSAKSVARALQALQHLPWARETPATLVLQMPSRYLLDPPLIGPGPGAGPAPASRVLRRLREAFHTFPRGGYARVPDCGYDESRLHIALHLKKPDPARESPGRSPYETVDYQLRRLKVLLYQLAHALRGDEEDGRPEPLLHVFTETQLKCPPMDDDEEVAAAATAGDAFFDEFPEWTVVPEQAKACKKAVPQDCPERRLQGFCNPVYPSVFDVLEDPLKLHVNGDPARDLYCLAAADAVVSGCGALGQLAALLSGGLRVFPADCPSRGGAVVASTHQFLPAVAVAERGELWVPVAGEGNDPALVCPMVLEREARRLRQLRGVDADPV